MSKNNFHLAFAITLVTLLINLNFANAQPPDLDSNPFAKPVAPKTFDDAAKLTMEFSPAKAKPGQVVTFKLTISPEIGCWTYPSKTMQASKNDFVLPKTGDVLFLQTYDDPPKPKTKKTTGDLYYPADVSWSFKAVVNPQAKPGKRKIEMPDTRLLVCNEAGCINYGGLKTVGAELEILDGPAEKVPDEFAGMLVSTAPLPPNITFANNNSVTSNSSSNNAADSKPKSSSEENASHEIQKKKFLPTEEYKARLKALSDTITKVEVKRQGGAWTLISTAAFWGLISLITPCVFPMIPITVSLFLKHGNQTTGGAVKLALVYCLTIIVVMTAAALIALKTFRAMSVHPIMNIALGLLFVVLALSLFGLFNLQLPNFMLRYAEGKRKSGGVVGTIFGAIAFSIVSFTCVAPFLGGFAGMADSNQYSNLEMLLAGLAFASAFASPFFLLALFPSMLKKLPKSGGWLETVKVVMGFLEIAAALKFFRSAELLLTSEPKFFTYDIVLTGWIVTMIVTGLYLLNIFRMPHDDEKGTVGVFQVLFAICFISLGIYLLPAIFKTAKGQQRPQGVVFNWIDAFLLPDQSIGGDELPWSADLPGMLDSARKEKKLVFVDFTGVTCTNCKDNEKNVFPLPDVLPLLKKYKLAQMYTDSVPDQFFVNPPSQSESKREAQANLIFQNENFKTEQLPLYVILEPTETGVKIVGTYEEGKINNKQAFIDFLRKPLESK